MTADPPEPAAGPAEYLGAGEVPPRRRRPRTGAWVAAAVGVAAVIGAGGWGVAQLMAGSTASPATALPAATLGYVSVNLDPSLPQKVDALRTLRKFPALKEQLSLGSGEDLRRWLFEQATKDTGCRQVSYDKDIAPWIGDQVAVAAVPQDTGKAFPVLAVASRDETKTRAAVAELDTCAGDGTHTGVAFVDGYALLAEKQAQADAAAGEAKTGSLADDPAFRTWMQRAGDPGVITAYAAKGAPQALAALQPADAPTLPGAGTPLAAAGRMYRDFQGMAAVVRFRDGGLETELVAKGLPAGMTGTDRTGPSVADLPASTAVAFSVGLPHGWFRSYLHTLDRAFSSDGSMQQMMKQGEAATGLRLPEDVETLLGEGVGVSVDSSLDVAGLERGPDPSRLPVALRIKGDPAAIEPVLGKLTALAGPEADLLTVKHTADTVVVGTDASYVDSLLTPGGLGSTTAFQEAVPHADRATSVLYVDFDAGDWTARLGKAVAADAPHLGENLAPLRALGISGWRDGQGVQHGLVRLTTG